MESINERIEKAMLARKLNINSFSKALGYKFNGTLYDVIKGKLHTNGERKKNRPGPELIDKLVAYGINYDYIMRGDMPMFKEELPDLEKAEVIELPVLEFYGSGSFAINSGDGLDRFIVNRKKIVRTENKEYYEGMYLIKIVGDSMMPTISSGTTLLARVIEKSRWIHVGMAVYAVMFDGRFEIKRVKENELSKGYLTLHADNEKYGKLEVKAESITQILKIEEIVQAKVM